jgi:hypothetical protein
LLAHPLDLFVSEPETGQVLHVAYLLLGYHLSPPALTAQREPRGNYLSALDVKRCNPDAVNRPSG